MISAIATIAYRDLLKFLRDRPRIVTSLVFPMVFVAFFGASMQASLADEVGFNFLVFTFTGILAMTLFQSSAMGIISLIDDRASDFSQEIFVAPISRYAIVLGKIIGESLVSLAQGILIVLFTALLRVEVTLAQMALLFVAGVLACLAGGAFGLLVLVNLRSRRAAEQIFPLLFLPQYFLAGVFAPIRNLPQVLDFISRLAPMRYAVDLVRGVFYSSSPTYAADAAAVVMAPPLSNAAVLAAIFGVSLAIGTSLFVRSERNR
jgi:ABC-2 type transport system permease protein